MTYPITCLLCTVILAIASGIIEALVVQVRTATGVGRNLEHDILLTGRLLIGGIGIVFLGYIEQASAMQMLMVTFACMAAFAMVHRVVFNLCHRKQITYMGPETRTAEDAQYDTLWHSIAAKEEVHERVLFRPDAVQYVPRFAHAPFVFAVVFEALVCGVCVFIALAVH
jgi:hypothetical protein